MLNAVVLGYSPQMLFPLPQIHHKLDHNQPEAGLLAGAVDATEVDEALECASISKPIQFAD